MTPAIFGLSGPSLTDDERAFFQDCEPAGYIVFGRNCASPKQLRALTDSLRELHGRNDLFICIDQEGGRVARLRPPEWRGFPSGSEFDRLYQIAPASAMQAAAANAEALGLELAMAGINVDCHPPLDLRYPSAHDVIGDRALGADPMQVAALGRSILEGLEKAGVAGCIKHMPGHGRSQVDTHKELPVVSASEDELARDIEPFKTLNDAAIGMTCHLVYTEWDAKNPATQSPTVIHKIIRERVGFDGLLLTDDIDMEALSGSIPERSEKAIEAGCDLVLNCWAKMDDMIGIVSRLPSMSDETARRLGKAVEDTASAPLDREGKERIAELVARRDSYFEAAGTAL